MTKKHLFTLLFLFFAFSVSLFAQTEKQKVSSPQVIFKINEKVVQNFSFVKKGDKANLSLKGEDESVAYRFNHLSISLQTQQKDGSIESRKIGGADVSGEDATGEGIDIPIPSDALYNPQKYDFVEVSWDMIFRVDAQGKLEAIKNSGGSILLRPKK